MACLFPGMVKVYDVGAQANFNSSHPLIHRHFHTPLSPSQQQQLAAEIALFLSGQGEHTVYSYFHCADTPSATQAEWQMSTAALRKGNGGKKDEVVVFTFDLKLLGDKRKKLYRVLDEQQFFKAHFNKVTLLTKREKEIIGLLAAGSSSEDIAGKLFVSVHTVNTHRKSINNKLAIKNIADLLRFADVFELNLTSHINA